MEIPCLNRDAVGAECVRDCADNEVEILKISAY